MNFFEIVFDEGAFDTIVGSPSFYDKFEKQKERALDQSAAVILNRLRTTYRQEQAPDGSPWVPSARGMKNKAKGRGQTMFDTGRLFRSLQLYASPKGERHIGTDVPYGIFHNEGKGQVKRQFLAFTDEHRELAENVFVLRLSEAFT